MNASTRHSPLDRDEAALSEQTPWYLNETLSDEDRRWFEARLADDDRLASALEFDRRIALTLEQRAAEVPADLGWDKLLRRVRAERTETTPAAPARPAGLWARFADRLSGLFTPAVGTAMAAVLVAQTVAIGFLVEREPSGAEYRSVGGVHPTPVIRAIVEESVTEKQLRTALQSQGATIVAGPSQLGEYLLRVEAGADRETVGKALQGEGILVSFSLDTRVLGQE